MNDLFNRILLITGTCLIFSCNFTAIRMQSEVIELRELPNGDYLVQVSYRFRGRVLGSLSIAFPEPEEYELKDFQRSWNGKYLPVERIQAQDGQGFLLDANIQNRNPIKNESSHRRNNFRGEYYIAKHVSHLPWTFREESVLVDEYRFTPPDWEPGSKSELAPGKYVEYILVTGSAWYGEIEEIEAFVLLADRKCQRIQIMEDSYMGDCDEIGNWHLVLKNLNPKQNIRLVVKP